MPIIYRFSYRRFTRNSETSTMQTVDLKLALPIYSLYLILGLWKEIFGVMCYFCFKYCFQHNVWSFHTFCHQIYKVVDWIFIYLSCIRRNSLQNTLQKNLSMSNDLHKEVYAVGANARTNVYRNSQRWIH